MRAHAQAVAGAAGDVLNVGFGMGLVDCAIQVPPSGASGCLLRAPSALVSSTAAPSSFLAACALAPSDE